MESTGEESMDSSPIELLPTETLQKILSYLPVHDRVRVERVCKRWRNVSTERVWRDIQVLSIAPRSENNSDLFRNPFKDSNHKFNTMKDNKLYIDAGELGVIQSLLTRAGQHIKKLIFDSGRQDSGPMLSIIATHCHNIESIQLFRLHNLNVQVFLRLFQMNKQLNSFACCYVRHLIEILPLRDWESLYIDDFSNLQEVHLENKMIQLIENSPSLEKFSIRDWTLNVAKAITKCEQLKHLSLPSWNEEVGEYLIKNTSLLNRLISLKAQDTGDANLMVNLLRNSINLERLHLLYWDRKIPDEVQKAMFDLPKLKTVRIAISGLTEGMLSRLGKFKHLILEQIYASIEEHEFFEMIQRSECLEKLEIVNRNITTELFERLAHDVRTRHKVLEIRVHSSIYEEALNICKDSRINIITDVDDFMNGL